MKIAFITTTFEHTPNGPSKFARLLYQFSMQQERSLVIFTEDISSDTPNVVKVNIPAYFNFSGVGFLFRLFKYFFEINKQRDIDIIVANNTMYGFLFNLLTHKKVIGFINDDQHINIRPSLKYSTIRSFIFSRFEKFALKRNQVTFVNSKYLKEALNRLYGLNNNALSILYKGIEMDDSPPLNLQKHKNDEVFHILFVKTNFKMGGLMTLLKGIHNLPNIHLDIVTSEAVKKSSEFKWIQDLNSVNLYHNLPQEKVFQLMQKAHCLCIPAVKEALGVANMEGMLHSCVILSTEVGGIPEVLNYGDAGMLIPEGDFVALREKMLLLQANREERERFVKNGYEFVKRFSIHHSIKTFYEVVEGEM